MSSFEVSMYEGLEEVSNSIGDHRKAFSAFVSKMSAFRTEIWLIHLKSSLEFHQLTETFITEFYTASDDLIELWSGSYGIKISDCSFPQVSHKTDKTLLFWISSVQDYLEAIKRNSSTPAKVLNSIDDLICSVTMLKSHAIRG